jgi:hypothetical protein
MGRHRQVNARMITDLSSESTRGIPGMFVIGSLPVGIADPARD